MVATEDAPQSSRNPDKSLVRSVIASGRWTVGALSLVAVTLAALFALVHWVYQPAVERSVAAHTVTRQAHEAMLDQQVGLRGYLASHDDRFLEAYRRGESALPALNAEATSLIGDESRLSGSLLEMRLAQRAWIDQWATEALRRGSEDEQVPMKFVTRDKVLFDEYRARYDTLIDKVVESRNASMSAAGRAIAIALAFALAVTAAAGVVGLRRSRRLRRDVDEPLTALLHRLDQIRGGDLAVREVPQGPSELRALGVGLEQASSALAEARLASQAQAEQLVARSKSQDEVLALAREVSGSLNLRYVLRGVCKHASAIASESRVVVWMLDDDRRRLEPRADSSAAELAPIGLEAIAVGEGLVGHASQYAAVRRADDDGAREEERLAVPMVVGARVVGVLEFAGPAVRDLSPDVVAVLEMMAIHAATAIEAARLHEHTSDLAMTDALTGLRNRRRLNIDLREECTVSLRYGRPLAYLMVDIDHFKSYNDSFGHQAGDVALQAVAQSLNDGLRTSDHAYRYGGEEFALVLRETSTEDAMVFAERLRRVVEHRFDGPGEPRPITVSVGVAGVSEDVTSLDALVAAADQALYEAKRAGRNRVRLAGQDRRDPPLNGSAASSSRRWNTSMSGAPASTESVTLSSTRSRQIQSGPE